MKSIKVNIFIIQILIITLGLFQPTSNQAQIFNEKFSYFVKPGDSQFFQYNISKAPEDYFSNNSLNDSLQNPNFTIENGTKFELIITAVNRTPSNSSYETVFCKLQYEDFSTEEMPITCLVIPITTNIQDWVEIVATMNELGQISSPIINSSVKIENNYYIQEMQWGSILDPYFNLLSENVTFNNIITYNIDSGWMKKYELLAKDIAGNIVLDFSIDQISVETLSEDSVDIPTTNWDIQLLFPAILMILIFNRNKIKK